MKKLVVVESPTKARTIKNFLPAGEFQVEASMGHIRDLPASAAQIPAAVKKEPWSRLGINVEENFEPLYVVPSGKKKLVQQLKRQLKQADELYIATDEDREGESIGWHLVNVLNPKVPVRRMVFHEITQEAIQDALNHTREINYDLVDAQETRRMLDRLVGYSISPLLWKKIAPRLSAGRVQSVAVRLIVQKEKERIAFVPAGYWGMKAALSKNGGEFEAVLSHLNDIRVAVGRDFDDETGRLREGLTNGTDIVILDEKTAGRHAGSLPDEVWKVADVEERDARRSPAAPFITSTLQQECSRKLGLSARQTMQVAQRLYEQGYITYMRTDSTTLSQEALDASRRVVVQKYGDSFLSKKPRTYTGTVANAQEAHEAIRPAGREMKTVENIKLSGVDAAVYDLIWKRTIASQMADARLKFTSVTISVTDGATRASFRASGKRIEFAGFFRAYVEGSDDPESALDDQEQPLPPLEVDEVLTCRSLEATGHETKPPARYSEASLIKILEKEGIGRPSTYATIMDTIVNRGYVRRLRSQLIPTFTAFATNSLLEQQFENLVDVGFTAEMEHVLDEIAAGERKSKPYLTSFYSGEKGLKSRIENALDAIDARAVSTISFAKWKPYVIRVGRYGPYVELEDNGEQVRASLPEDLAPGDVTRETLEALVTGASKSDEPLGTDPESGLPVLSKHGPYGHYVQLGTNDDNEKPRRQSIPKGLDPSEVDLAKALDLLRLPRDVGPHPESGDMIVANIGRYGPYVKHGKTFASLQAADDVLTVGLERAVELIQKKSKRNEPLRTIGDHPKTGDSIDLFEGRYGPYVKMGRTNVSLPKGTEPGDVTLDEAVTLIDEKQAKTGKVAGKKKTARKSTKKSTKKTAGKARKSTKKTTGKAKKSATRKTTGKDTGSARKTTGKAAKSTPGSTGKKDK
jgi:DNA topoisomerase-1